MHPATVKMLRDCRGAPHAPDAPHTMLRRGIRGTGRTACAPTRRIPPTTIVVGYEPRSGDRLGDFNAGSFCSSTPCPLMGVPRERSNLSMLTVTRQGDWTGQGTMLPVNSLT